MKARKPVLTLLLAAFVVLCSNMGYAKSVAFSEVNTLFSKPIIPQFKLEDLDNGESDGGDDLTNDLENGGTISGNEMICQYTQPEGIVNEASPTVGEGELITIKWEKRVIGGVWIPILGASGLSYQPGILTETTQFRRASRKAFDQPWIYSNIVTKNVTEGIDNINVSVRNVTCKGGSDGWAVVSVEGGTPDYTYEWSTGSPNNSVTNLSPGSYSITVTDQNGCAKTNENVVITEPEKSVEAVEVLTVDAVCPGSEDGVIFVEAIDGEAPYIFEWSDGSFGYANPGLKAGSYHVTVTDALGCEHRLEGLTVQEPAAFEVEKETSAVTCYGLMDGKSEIFTTGGTAPYTFKWSDGGEGDSRSSLAPGSQEVTITDINGCTYTEEITIPEPDELELDPITSNNKLCKGSISVVPSGGTAPYEFSWDNGENTSFINDLCPGEYTVVVTDVNGCEEKRTLSLDAEFERESVEIQIIVNPFNEKGSIRINFPYESRVDVKVYSATGQLVEELYNGDITGNKEMNLNLDLNRYTGGLYFITVNTPGGSASEKLLIAQ